MQADSKGCDVVNIFKAVLLVALAGVVLYGLHRLAIWAEDRGWLYYRKRGGTWRGTAAAQELQALLHPSSRHVVEEGQRQELTRQDDSDYSDPQHGTGWRHCAPGP
jgi:hypothetical protein